MNDHKKIIFMTIRGHLWPFMFKINPGNVRTQIKDNMHNSSNLTDFLHE